MGNEKTELTSFSKAGKWQGIVRSSCSLLAAAVKGNVTECQKTAYFIAASLLPFNDSGAEPSLTTLSMLSALKANKMSSFQPPLKVQVETKRMVKCMLLVDLLDISLLPRGNTLLRK